MSSILPVRDSDTIRRCYPVMAQLRPHLDQESLVAQVQRQFTTQQYFLAALEEDGQIVAVAGYRYLENLVYGAHLYVDDLITDEAHRGRGHGGQLFDWLVEEARHRGCAALHLDSGIQRFAAHRFYLGKRMEVTARHFGMAIA